MKQLKTDKTRKMQCWLVAPFVMILAALLIGTFVKNGQDVTDTEYMETLEVVSDMTIETKEEVMHAEVSESEVRDDAETETREEENTSKTVEGTDAGLQVMWDEQSEEPAKQEISFPSEESVSNSEEVFEEEHKEEHKEEPIENTDNSQNEDTTAVAEPENDEGSVSDEVAKTEPEVSAEPEKHEHNWMFESYYQNPTCSNGGLVTEICVQCGETQITGGVPTGKHSFKVETRGDCCSEEVVACSECNFREVRDKDPKNHIDIEDGFCYGCGQKVE